MSKDLTKSDNFRKLVYKVLIVLSNIYCIISFFICFLMSIFIADSYTATAVFLSDLALIVMFIVITLPVSLPWLLYLLIKKKSAKEKANQKFNKSDSKYDDQMATK